MSMSLPESRRYVLCGLLFGISACVWMWCDFPGMVIRRILLVCVLGFLVREGYELRVIPRNSTVIHERIYDLPFMRRKQHRE